MIGLTRTSGEPCRLHPADIERVETHPCTLVYLTDGSKYGVIEDVDEIVRRVRDSRAKAMMAVYRLVPPALDTPRAPTPSHGVAVMVPMRSRRGR